MEFVQDLERTVDCSPGGAISQKRVCERSSRFLVGGETLWDGSTMTGKPYDGAQYIAPRGDIGDIVECQPCLAQVFSGDAWKILSQVAQDEVCIASGDCVVMPILTRRSLTEGQDHSSNARVAAEGTTVASQERAPPTRLRGLGADA